LLYEAPPRATALLWGRRFRLPISEADPVDCFSTLPSLYTAQMEPRKLPFSRIRLTPEAVHCIAHAAPAYPPDAKLNHIEGTVILQALIDTDGKIQTLSVHSGHPLLAESALRTVQHWAYRPTKVNGIAVEVETRIEVNFTLPDENVS
jgi:TonB family protein